MERRQLPGTELEISPVGIGTAPIGSGRDWPVWWGPQDERDSLDAIRTALDLGVNWIDTAPFYGWGRAEEIVGRALNGRRDNVLLFTKCGTFPDESGSRMDLRPERIRADVEASLRRLRTDRVDLLQVHDVAVGLGAVEVHPPSAAHGQPQCHLLHPGPALPVAGREGVEVRGERQLTPGRQGHRRARDDFRGATVQGLWFIEVQRAHIRRIICPGHHHPVQDALHGDRAGGRADLQ